MNTTTQAPSTTTNTIRLGHFQGTWSAFQSSFFVDLKAVGCDARIAHKICQDYASDLSRAIASGDAELNSKVGKANKDSARALRISGKTARVTSSNAMNLKVIVQHIDDMYAEKLTLKRTQLDSIKLIEPLATYLEEAKEWASKQTWAE